MLEERVKDLIATKAKIDRERIRIVAPTADEACFVVGIKACTEPEYRGIQKGLNATAEQGIRYRVVRDEDPAKPPAYDLKRLREMLKGFGTAPDGHLADTFAKQCARFAESEERTLPEMLTFLRNLRDNLVFCSGASSFVLQVINMMLEDYPEPEDEMDERRRLLPR